MPRSKLLAAGLLPMFAGSSDAESAADVAQQSSEPFADFISVLFKLNCDEDLGANDDAIGSAFSVRPNISIDVYSEWSPLSRNILPVFSTYDIPTGSGSEKPFFSREMIFT